MSTTINGRLERIFFGPTDDHFVIGRFAGPNGAFSAKGTVLEAQVGLEYELTGEWVQDPKFGRQFSVETSSTVEPKDHDALASYLQDHAKWVGPVIAEKIIELFGDDALDVCKNDPAQLVQINGITEERAAELSDALRSRKDLEKVDLGLRQLLGGIVSKTALKRIRSRWGIKAVEHVTEKPYDMVYYIEGVGFPTADKVARQKLQIAHDDPYRIEAGIFHVLQEASRSGHVCVPHVEGVKVSRATLGVTQAQVETQIVESPLFEVEDEMLFLESLRRAEIEVSEGLMRLLHAESRVQARDADEVIEALQAAHEEDPEVNFLPAADQCEALRKACQSNVFILSGAPGTGKTTVLRQVLDLFGQGELVALAAPSGKAAKRMSEQTGRAASTIHKLLECVPDEEGGFNFGRDAENPLLENVIVIDESSMVDIGLMAALVKAVRRGSRLLIVGDFYQLPSVGPGNVLKHLIESESIPSVELTIIKRQDDQGLIVRNCHAIKDGRMIEVANETCPDFQFYEVDDEFNAQRMIVDLAARVIPERWSVSPNFDPLRDIQVITARREESMLSAKELNPVLQDAINPNGFSREGYQFRVGDKIIQLKNEAAQCRDTGEKFTVVNGDIGYVEELIDRPAAQLINFENPERRIGMPKSTFNMDLAYAITVHKFQGSEADVVIIPVHGSSGKRILQRNWLYTAASRGKKLVILVGQREAVAGAISRNDNTHRYSLLARRLRNSVGAGV